ncbi:MAG TPA: glycosyltransferase family 39 protein [Polyangiales bacterium]
MRRHLQAPSRLDALVVAVGAHALVALLPISDAQRATLGWSQLEGSFGGDSGIGVIDSAHAGTDEEHVSDAGMMRPLENRTGAWATPLALALLWGVIVFAVGLGGDYPLNDDWAYAWSARHFLQTGTLRILDMAAPSLVAHIAWGAAMLRVFGDSGVVLRAGTLVWALVCILLLYLLGRRAGHPRHVALVPALALALSPWFVNLSFTYMTDVPWLTLVLAALLATSAALDPRSRAPLLLLAAASTLFGAAALMRQFAVFCAFGTAVAVWLDSRNTGRSQRETLTRLTALLLPLVLLFGLFEHWYIHVHGPTLANRETVTKIRRLDPWMPLQHALESLHYLGLWLSPFFLAALFGRKLRAVLTRPHTRLGLALLVGYVIGAQLLVRSHNPASTHQPTMPFLSNIFFLVGLGPQTLDDIYQGRVPQLHHAPWLGWLLTLVSTCGGLVAVSVLLRSGAAVWQLRRGPAEPTRNTLTVEHAQAHARDFMRTLCFCVGVAYLGWHVATAQFIFDRYLLPLLPLILLLALDVLPEPVVASRWALLLLALGGLWAVAGTREYLSWNDARWAAVRALSAQGIPDDQVDGGYEVNGPRHFLPYFKRTGRLLPKGYAFWISNAPYRLSFWPDSPGCETYARYPFWTWPGGGEHAMHVLRCKSTP